MSIIWTWQSGLVAKTFSQWLSQAALPENRQQADQAFKDGRLVRWLQAIDDSDSLEAASKADSITSFVRTCLALLRRVWA
jgi:hypothetical protein